MTLPQVRLRPERRWVTGATTRYLNPRTTRFLCIPQLTVPGYWRVPPPLPNTSYTFVIRSGGYGRIARTTQIQFARHIRACRTTFMRIANSSPPPDGSLGSDYFLADTRYTPRAGR